MFYDNLKKTCDDQKLKITPIVIECGGSPGSISGWKKGKPPNSEIVIALSKRLGVSSDYLLGISDEDRFISLAIDSFLKNAIPYIKEFDDGKEADEDTASSFLLDFAREFNHLTRDYLLEKKYLLSIKNRTNMSEEFKAEELSNQVERVLDHIRVHIYKINNRMVFFKRILLDDFENALTSITNDGFFITNETRSSTNKLKDGKISIISKEEEELLEEFNQLNSQEKRIIFGKISEINYLKKTQNEEFGEEIAPLENSICIPVMENIHNSRVNKKQD